MTQKELNHDAIMAIFKGYSLFRKVGTWREELRIGRDAGFIIELVETPARSARFAQVSYALLDEDDEAAPLRRGEDTWLKINRDELIERI